MQKKTRDPQDVPCEPHTTQLYVTDHGWISLAPGEPVPEGARHRGYREVWRRPRRRPDAQEADDAR